VPPTARLPWPRRLTELAVSVEISGGSAVKLTFAIAVVALVLIAGTTTICMSGAVTDNTIEYGGVHATMEAFFNPHVKVCR
jgi:hypothetical protein